jgi:hypothetical protein
MNKSGPLSNKGKSKSSLSQKRKTTPCFQKSQDSSRSGTSKDSAESKKEFLIDEEI